MISAKTLALASLMVWAVHSTSSGYDYSDYTWLSANGHEYTITFTAGEWLEAETEAVAVGGHLVTINAQAENDWLCDVLAPFFGIEKAHIGFTDQRIEGYWEWIGEVAEPGQSWDGGIWQHPDFFSSPIQTSFTYWHSGEPNDSQFNGGEDYCEIRLSPEFSGDWNDINGSDIHGHPGIIEIPEPCSILLFILAGSVLVQKRC